MKMGNKVKLRQGIDNDMSIYYSFSNDIEYTIQHVRIHLGREVISLINDNGIRYEFYSEFFVPMQQTSSWPMWLS